MMTHVPIMGLELPARNILIVGGGDGAMAREALRHESVQRVAMVELDGMVVEGATLEHGLLHIDLARPEPEKRVTQVPIRTAG